MSKQQSYKPRLVALSMTISQTSNKFSWGVSSILNPHPHISTWHCSFAKDSLEKTFDKQRLNAKNAKLQNDQILEIIQGNYKERVAEIKKCVLSGKVPENCF